MIRDDNQRAQLCDRLVRSLHPKGITWASGAPSEVALATMEQIEAHRRWRQLLASFLATGQRQTARTLEEALCPVGISDADVLQLQRSDSSALPLTEESSLDERARLLGSAGVELVEHSAEGGAGLSHGEELMFLAAWDVWGRRGKVSIEELLGTLDGENLELVGSLLVALARGSSSALDRWLADHEGGRHG